MKARRNLAASVRRILAAAGDPAAVTVITARPARLPLARARIRQSAGPLAVLASYLAAPGPVPAQGVATVSQLLADGAGPSTARLASMTSPTSSARPHGP